MRTCLSVQSWQGLAARSLPAVIKPPPTQAADCLGPALVPAYLYPICLLFPACFWWFAARSRNPFAFTHNEQGVTVFNSLMAAHAACAARDWGERARNRQVFGLIFSFHLRLPCLLPLCPHPLALPASYRPIPAGAPLDQRQVIVVGTRLGDAVICSKGTRPSAYPTTCLCCSSCVFLSLIPSPLSRTLVRAWGFPESLPVTLGNDRVAAAVAAFLKMGDPGHGLIYIISCEWRRTQPAAQPFPMTKLAVGAKGGRSAPVRIPGADRGP